MPLDPQAKMLMDQLATLSKKERVAKQQRSEAKATKKSRTQSKGKPKRRK